MRSISIGTQLMPPSENAILMFGKRVGTRAHSQSAAVTSAFTGNRLVYSSSGAPGERAAVHDDDPLCRHTTVSVSSHARRNGSQWSVCIDGSCEVDRVLGEADGLEAARRVGADVGGRDLGIVQPGELQRDDAVGVRPGPLVDVPVVPRAQRGEPELLVLALGEDRAREPGDERREAQRRVDAVEVHVGDARLDVVATAAHLVEARRLHAPLGLGPAGDRVEPDLRVEAVFVDPRLAPVVERDDAAARASGRCRGHAPLEEVGRFDEVIVDRDDRVVPRARGSGSGSSVAVTRTSLPSPCVQNA